MSRLTGVSKHENRSVFTFTKEQSFYPPFKMLLLELGFDEWQIPDWRNPEDEGSPSIDVEGLTDHYIHGASKGLSIDLILGKQRIFVLASGPQLEEFNEAIAKRFSF